MNMLFKTISSPVGPLTLTEQDGALCGLTFGEKPICDTALPGIVMPGDCPLFAQTEKELSEYFAGKRKVFTVPVSLSGTGFQLKVWQALTDIPYGETRSYGDIAKAIGSPNSCRAVGGANHNNPVSIIVPCHRVIGADGSLTGYGGGLTIKRYLLRLEGIL